MGARFCRFMALLCGLLVAAVLVGCGSSDGDGTQAGSVPAGAVVIDVRTPSEYAAGHLSGARNIDFEADSFDAAVAGLPADTPYIVYCQTGNRSARAVAAMREAGLSDVADVGGIDDAELRTGLPVVTG